MKLPPYLIVIIFICIFMGIILSILNNDLANFPSNNNQQLILDRRKNLYKKINYTIEEGANKQINQRFEKYKNKNEGEEKDEEEEEIIKNIEKTIQEEEERKKREAPSNYKLNIACAYATDNRYIYPTLVAMTSLAENAGPNTFYSIYVMINHEFSDENKIVLKSVEYNHPANCEVIFINMGEKFKDANTNEKIPTAAYYRLELHNLLPDVSRIIWMDGDTAVFEDLTELINLDMKGNYIMGFLDSLPDALEKNFGMKNVTVLCSGVLLMDLEALRKNNMTEKFRKFMIEKKDKINQHDQTVINVVCQKNIAPLPPKYGIWSFEAKKYGLMHNNRQRPHLKYNEKEFVNAYYHPAILHYVWPKPFWRKQKPVFNDQWWDYARKSGYYNEIFNNSPKKILRNLLTMLEYSGYIYYKFS